MEKKLPEMLTFCLEGSAQRQGLVHRLRHHAGKEGGCSAFGRNGGSDGEVGRGPD